MKVIIKSNAKDAVKKLKDRGLACEPHSMCPRCLSGRG